MPKLVAEDIPLLHSLLSDVFPGVKYVRAEMKTLREEIAKVCAEMHLACGETGSQWMDKVRVQFICSTKSSNHWGGGGEGGVLITGWQGRSAGVSLHVNN